MEQHQDIKAIRKQLLGLPISVAKRELDRTSITWRIKLLPPPNKQNFKDCESTNNQSDVTLLPNDELNRIVWVDEKEFGVQKKVIELTTVHEQL